MHTIERMAELLEPLQPSGAKRVEPSGLEDLERATLRIAGEREVATGAVGRSAAGTAQTIPAEPGQPSRPALALHKIERAHLLRQSLITPDGDRTPNAEAFRRIKRQILAKASKPKDDLPVNLVMVTSALTGEGKTFCAVSLAISMAVELDRTVLLVDADVAKPSVPRMLGLKADHGLLDVLQDRRIGLADVLCKTDVGKLTVLPAGTPHRHATELLASDAMRRLLEEIAERYRDRIVIFDSPPLLAASEAGVLASRVGQLVIVVEAGRTSEAALQAAMGRIETSNVTGLVLNKGENPGQRYEYGEYGKLAK